MKRLMYRVLVTAVWVAIFATAILGTGTAIVAFTHYLDPGIAQVSYSWRQTASIAVVLLGCVVLLRAIWPHLIITARDFDLAVREAGGEIVLRGRHRRASFGGCEVAYYFPRGLVGFDIFWVKPKWSPEKKMIERRMGEGDGWIGAERLWHFVTVRAPLVVRMSGAKESEPLWKELVCRLRSDLPMHTVEVWSQRRIGDQLQMRPHGECKDSVGLSEDDVFILVYVAPWERKPARHAITLVSEICGDAAANQGISGPGWPDMFE